MKVYVAIATCVNVIKWRKVLAIAKPNNGVNMSALDLWEDRFKWLEKEVLPSGSGIDSGTEINLKGTHADRITLNTAFHHMDPESGMYDGWTTHQVIVQPSLMHPYKIRVTGPNKRDIKGYLSQVYGDCMDREIEWPN